MGLMVLFGRVLYAAVFLIYIPGQITEVLVRHPAGQGSAMIGFLVLAGVFALLGGLGIIIGYKAKAGAWLIILYLAPATLMMRKFWDIADPAAAVLEQIDFMKNLSILGTALLIAYFGSGPFSLDKWLERRARNRFGTKMIDLTARRW